MAGKELTPGRQTGTPAPGPPPALPAPPPMPAAAAPRRELTLFDSTCIIVGIIIGSSIYLSGPMIAGNVPNVAWLIGVWLLGGLFSLIGRSVLRRAGHRLSEGGRRLRLPVPGPGPAGRISLRLVPTVDHPARLDRV